MTEKFKIKLKEGAEPFSLPMVRKLSVELREATKKELQKMESLGVIEKVEEYTGNGALGWPLPLKPIGM